MSEEITFIPDRLNEEPIVFLSMTDGELKYAALVTLLGWGVVTTPIALLFGKGILALGATPLFAVGTMWLIGKRLRVVKRGKPKGFHVMAIRAWLEDRAIVSKTMIRRNFVWDIRRNAKVKS